MDRSVSVVTGLLVSQVRILVSRFVCGVGSRSSILRAKRVAMVFMGMRVVLMSLRDQQGQLAVMAVRVL